MNIEWLKNKSDEKFYPVSHSDSVLCGENSDKTLTQSLQEISETYTTPDDVTTQINEIVCEVEGNVYVDGSGEETDNYVPVDADTLEGHSADYFASATSVTNITDGTTVVAKATSDGNGNNIVNTYATIAYVDSLVNGLINGES